MEVNTSYKKYFFIFLHLFFSLKSPKHVLHSECKPAMAFIFREGVRGGAGWAIAPPKISPTKGKNLYFCKYTKNFSNIRLTSPHQKKIPNALPALP